MATVPKSFFATKATPKKYPKPQTRSKSPVTYAIVNNYTEENYIGAQGQSLESTLEDFSSIIGNYAISDLSFYKCTPIKVTTKLQVTEVK